MDNEPKIASNVIHFNNSSPNQNFGLAQDEFSVMLDQMQTGQDQLFEHIFLSHFEDCRKFLASKYSMEYEVSYDITMDTMLEFRLKLLQGKIVYGNLRYLFTRMASNNYLSQMTYEQKLKQVLKVEEIEEEYHEHQFDQLDKAWKALDDSERTILTQYYYEDRTLKNIANDMKENDAAMRKKKQRAMESLKEVFFKFINTN